MGIQSFTPSGGGGTPGFDYINSVNMVTYNRSWAQSGAAGNYVLASYNKNSGYAYFVGSGVTTGIPLGYVAVVNHAFTSINIVAPTNDYISLFKASAKTTTVFNNALDAFASFPSMITTSGNFVLPNNALPLINVHLVGSGGGGGHHSGGGGGGGGIVKLTAYQAVGTTSVTIASGAGSMQQGNRTYFGNIYATGGGAGGGHGSPGGSGANGGGGGAHSGYHIGGSGVAQTASTGLGSTGSPTFTGGFTGGICQADGSWNYVGAGGAGAGGNGQNRTNSTDVNSGGIGHVSDITGSNYTYSVGAGGGSHSPGRTGTQPGAYGSGGAGSNNDGNTSIQGVVVVRYYIP